MSISANPVILTPATYRVFNAQGTVNGEVEPLASARQAGTAKVRIKRGDHPAGQRPVWTLQRRPYPLGRG